MENNRIWEIESGINAKNAHNDTLIGLVSEVAEELADRGVNKNSMAIIDAILGDIIHEATVMGIEAALGV